MFLLGHTLDLQIKVTRISSFGQEDYLTYYPQGDCPQDKIISISAEDDRHYNALATLEILMISLFHRGDSGNLNF